MTRAEDFTTVVEQLVGVDDAGDLCFSLMEMGVIDANCSAEEAARIVAQHLEQP